MRLTYDPRYNAAYIRFQENGIIALQVHNHPKMIPQLVIRLTTYIASHPTMEEYKGKPFLVEAHRIRIRE